MEIAKTQQVEAHHADKCMAAGQSYSDGARCRYDVQGLTVFGLSAIFVGDVWRPLHYASMAQGADALDALPRSQGRSGVSEDGGTCSRVCVYMHVVAV